MSGPRIEIYFHVCSVRWTLYIGILTLSPAHLCRVTSYLDSKYWMITENNKGVTGVMLDDDNNTNILITDSWPGDTDHIPEYHHSFVRRSRNVTCLLWCDIICNRGIPSQWVISTSVTSCDTGFWISELWKCHEIETQSLTFNACCIREYGTGFRITVTCCLNGLSSTFNIISSFLKSKTVSDPILIHVHF